MGDLVPWSESLAPLPRLPLPIAPGIPTRMEDSVRSPEEQ